MRRADKHASTYMHADWLSRVAQTKPLDLSPETDDPWTRPDLYERLEAALWRRAAIGETGRVSSCDVDEALHPVAGIELDA